MNNNKENIIKELTKLKEYNGSDIYEIEKELLLELINDEKISKLSKEIEDWYEGSE